MKYAAEMGSEAMIYIPSFMKYTDTAWRSRNQVGKEIGGLNKVK
jgi:hypothetical protein